MPGLSQLRKLSEDVLRLGNEPKLRAERGEKPVVAKIPSSVQDIDDSDDFVLGMPEKETVEVSENLNDDSVESLNLENNSLSDTTKSSSSIEEPDLSGLLNPINDIGSEMPDLSAFEEPKIPPKKEEPILADMSLDDLLKPSTPEPVEEVFELDSLSSGEQGELTSSIDTDLLEAHYMSGGAVVPVVQALIAANKANIDLNFKQAAAIDLAGRNVLEAVQMSVNPKVIQTPKVSAVALDGIQLHAITRITVRASIQKLVGGAGEDTVVARVGEGIVSSIGSALSHKDVLENPNMISKKVLASGLDAGTAFEILSIDIADVDVGQNIGAILETDRAEADKKIAQAKAEERRAMAFAAEQEMKAKVMEMRAKLVESEAEVPMAMAVALREGKLGVMDYYNLKNIEADTQMRKDIGGLQESQSPSDGN